MQLSRTFSTYGYSVCSILPAEGNVIPRFEAIRRNQSSFSKKPDPKAVTTDYVGPFDPNSNIRQYVRHISLNETTLATRLREKQIEVEKWNHIFWENHNKLFYNQRQEFIKQHNLSANEDSYQDKLSEFYKKFLDENHRRHVIYNWAWYKKNLDILLLSLRVKMENALKNKKTVDKK